MGQQNLTTKARGLWLTSNPLDAPAGSLSEATNAVTRRHGVVEPRRGQRPDATVPGGDVYVSALTSFEDALILHSSNNAFGRRVDSTTVSAYAGTFPPPTGKPARFVEATGALYATTGTGPVRLDSPTDAWVQAGVPPGLEGMAETTGSSGWLANNQTVGYRVGWGARDGDGQLMVGAPSGRFLVTNTSGAGRDVLLNTPVPDGIDPDVHFLLVWRTVLTVPSGSDPGEDMAQVAEYFPTAADVAAGSITLTDIAAFSNGATAYFSPSLGVGISGAKEMPPLLTDMVVFNGHVFGVVEEYRQSFGLSLLAVGGDMGLVADYGLVFTRDGVDEFTVMGVASTENPSGGEFEVYTSGTAAQNIEDTARSLVRVLNEFPDSTVYATYISEVGGLPGAIQIFDRVVGDGELEVAALGSAMPWTPHLGSRITGTVSRTSGVVTVSTIPATAVAALRVGETVDLVQVVPAPDPNFPLGVKTITGVNTGTGTFTYAEAGPDGAGTGDAYRFTTTSPEAEFDQPAAGSDYAHSDLEEPDAWPPRFRFKVGNLNTQLYRIIAQGNALLFFTSDGLFRMTGRTADEFVLIPVDPTLVLTASKTAVSMGNQAFALTNKGVVSITDLGVEKISEPIDQALLPYYGGESTEVANTEAFAVAYETENEYTLFLPNPNGDPGDPPDRAYTYNTQTGVWVGPWEFEWEGINDGTKWVQAAHVHKADGRLYISSGDRLTRERKTRTLLDYQDADDVGIPMDVATVVNTAQNPGAYKQWVEATVLLEKPQPSEVEVYFTTELDEVEEGTDIPTQGNLAVRTYVPLDKSRSSRLTVGVRYQAAQEKMAILGIQTVANVTSTRVGR